jgi:hypothetical protein
MHSYLVYLTLNIIFSVVGTYEPYPTIFPLHLGGFVIMHTKICRARGLHGNSPLEVVITRQGLGTDGDDLS